MHNRPYIEVAGEADRICRSDPDNNSITVLGAGSWGTALALLLARNGLKVTLWGHQQTHMDQLHKDRSNERYLPQSAFPDNLSVTSDLAVAASCNHTVLIVVPSRSFRETLQAIAPLIGDITRVAWATKGIELSSGKLLHIVAREELGKGRDFAFISGPTFAREVANDQPTAATVASENESFAMELASMLHGPAFRAYTTTDMIGAQLGGAIKNVLAIAVGMAEGLGFGANARSALITRGLAEMMPLGLALGARPETLMGLAGVGDLILTCTDNQSRNRRFGLGVGKGLPFDDVIRSIGQEIEGIDASAGIYRLAQQHGVEMPITEQVYKVLHEGLTPREAAHNLLMREQKPENKLRG
ncbi:NAD(P)H-dependent glycerol-3-phosphate dehydrogenase [Candidatus Methylospira mobilis]|uniref:NAD(P)H-dependent glycerol-3-phosphate dehydrogenase n=1 Tax=Candidatus Methylospira mobilis TaxID=1808979 RepID=UPI0028EDB6D7|nr:NAD(P)H-dependent glycerol-3-phosphate dehydrogenase [Candidatus Methylospira mobilis]WNV04566.1 NAD(P)H-dependent glycerol-3-phosphate dehydrogenase [Candidatus Methylospira mobilis]